MDTFEIREDFLLNNKPFKILSGAIHYFRVHPDDWYHSLYNLKALGFNTVETYIPWNMHEAKKGQFSFEGILDLERFLKMAQEIGLYAIVRPSPYICAEWEMGGLPAWLLNESCHIRSSDPAYLKHVAQYYDVLIKKLVSHQLSAGGNILMVQVENEYGSFGEEKAYLYAIRELLQQRGITMPLFTSDGPWRATLRTGSMIDEDILVTGNFGSKGKENFASMQSFFDEHQKKWPLMCMEFWDGWFNRWKEPIVKRDPEELAEAIHEVIELGSINLYMFHGGTNFGFMNGCSARGQTDLPQITSYDYGAPLDEQGNPTEKYYAIRRMLQHYYPEIEQKSPLIKESMQVKNIPLVDKVSLFSTIETISQPIESTYPQTMESLGQNTGYLLYRTLIEKDAQQEKIRIIDGRDRAQLFVDDQLMATQYQHEIGEDVFIHPKEGGSKVDLLMENMGRVNYGHRLLTETQKKGLRQGVIADLHFITNWQQYCIPLETGENIDFTARWQQNTPSFYRYEVQIDTPQDCFIDLSGFGKGVVLVNNVNIGRFWEVGPTLSLYIPKGYLSRGNNEIIIFETEGRYQTQISLLAAPVFKTMKEG
ncbi:glycoside hydrolase family 35 protein [Tetragenococcus halophilus]|uniref:glycoside hydrolase family 35 protein n=1 Tax=Tetragenococcus halophilus TaxID=51669 RepID=UPI001F38B70F|nr:beta-galactosidase family protein [Tetragenococcus halophilus]MDN6195312.1 beta-galactosidase [Atopostipes suicloacalis]MDN6497781.1 beta-galactosidase [Tetragenococcus koreensis]MCF1600767.1 beta-galactosidase [Tetragenococcus halophilus]MCF1676329.1 beta-galactosidase [Tetragenococcus halophilus]MDN6143298.1 beta-galactosidase [Tetragenococcus halophilus]